MFTAQGDSFMKEFIRRLRPDHLAGQIALLILAAIIFVPSGYDDC